MCIRCVLEDGGILSDCAEIKLISRIRVSVVIVVNGLGGDMKELDVRLID